MHRISSIIGIETIPFCDILMCAPFICTQIEIEWGMRGREMSSQKYNPPKRNANKWMQRLSCLLFKKKKTQQFCVRTITNSCNYSCHMAHVFLPKSCVAARLLYFTVWFNDFNEIYFRLSCDYKCKRECKSKNEREREISSTAHAYDLML